MNFEFSEEQNLLRQSLSRYLADRYSYAVWRDFTRAEAGHDPAHWRAFAEMGLLAASLPEAHDGLGGGPVELMLIMEEFGRRLVIEPFVPTIVIGAGLLQAVGSNAQKSEWLPRIAKGDCRMAFAFAEAKGRYDLSAIVTTATAAGDGYRIDGHKSVVIGAPFADTLIVTAKTEEGIGIFLVDKAANGVSLTDYPTIDGNRASEIALENVTVDAARRLGSVGMRAALEKVVDASVAAHCAEALGATAMLNTATVAYAKTRQQFGQPISQFQALQHRMADMHIAQEQAQSAMLLATLKADPRSVSAAKAVMAQSARIVGEGAVQIHGGIGMTDELDIGHFFKRLTVLAMLYGDRDHHLRRLATLG